MCVYREKKGSSYICRVEDHEVDLEFCADCPYLREEKRGFCAFLKDAPAGSKPHFFQRYCTRDQRLVWLSECCVCPHHT